MNFTLFSKRENRNISALIKVDVKLPEKMKKGPYSKFSVNIEDNFKEPYAGWNEFDNVTFNDQLYERVVEELEEALD